MKFPPIFLSLAGCLISPVSAQDETKVDSEVRITKWDVEIPEQISDGTPAKPVAKPVPIDFNVISSRSKKVDVIKAPEMHDLPPITGRVTVTVQLVEDPELPEPQYPLPALEPDDPAVVARMEELQEKYQGTDLVFISASVYDHKRTLLRIHTSGEKGSELTAWSNLDFNHFSGFSTYRVKDAVDGMIYDYGILMGLGNEDIERLSELSTGNGWKYHPPEIPALPDVEDGGPTFVVMEGDAGSPAMATLEQIHDLYRKEGARMEAAHHAREKALAERRAYLLANPPVPDDVTIRFWKRNAHTSPVNPSVKENQ